MQKYTLFTTRFLTVCILFLAFQLHLHAQTAAIFAPGILSDGQVFGLTLSPDGQTAVFVKAYGGRDSLHLLTSSLMNGNWTKPIVAPFSTRGTSWKDIDPAFSPDGKLLLFNSTRPLSMGPAKEDFDIWGVKRDGNSWGEPFHLGAAINTDSSDIYATIAKSGNIYFSSNRAGGQGKLDLYVSEYQNGVYQSPKNLGALLNTENHDSNPFISPKEDYIIFWGRESSGYGDSDLYISFKQKGNWTKPLNLGPNINSKQGDFCPFMQPKGKKLYFSRTEEKDGKRIEDLYSIDFSPKEWNKLAKNSN
ncbi:hypothetical protein [Haliscomenobacter sp.]|uniref:hypothetical protein n=1 Tax=Haliscomenobacter sp. TaxID=2717303 RepID=UPI0035934A54